MIKKFISLVLVSTFFFSPCGFSQDSAVTDPAQAKLDKAVAEANRNKELLEIWKEHVKTLTQERDDAYRQIESLKTVNSSPVIVGQPARFGEIETQPLPGAMVMPKNIPLQNIPVDNSGLLKDIQNYQGSIKELRAQLGELQSQNQRMKKEILESGSDKTLIIKDKEEGIAKIEALTRQITALNDENQRLTGLLHSRPLEVPVAQPPAVNTAKPAVDPSAAFLQNAYNTQSVKLKKVIQEKEETLRRAEEIQKKYVDLQASVKPVSAAPVQDVFEVNYLKSQNSKLKAELEKLRAGVKAKEEPPVLLPSADAVKIKQIENENQSLELQLSDTSASLEAMKHNFDRLNLENEETKAEYNRLKSDLSSARSTATDSQNAKAASLQQILTAISAEKSTLQSRNQTLTAQVNSLEKNLKDTASDRARLKQQNESFVAQMSSLKDQNSALTATAAGVSGLEESRNTLKTNLEKNAAEKDELLTRNRALMEELNASKENAKQMAVSLSSAIANASAYEGSQNTLKMNLEKNAAERDELLNRNRALMEELNTAKEDLAQQMESVKSQEGAREGEIQKIRSEIDVLQKKNELLRVETAKIPQYETEKKYLQNIYSEASYKVKRSQMALDQAIKKLEASKTQNQKLTAQIEADRSAYQARQADSDALKAKLQALLAEKDTMNGQIVQLRGTIDQLQAQTRKAKNDAVLTEDKVRAMEVEKGGLANQIDSLRSQVTLLESEKQKINTLSAEKEKLAAETETMKKAMIDLEREAQTAEDRVNGLNDQISTLENTRAEQAKTIDSLNASLKQSLDDIQNLKNNFQSYLESLVTSFEDRQKKGAPAPAETI